MALPSRAARIFALRVLAPPTPKRAGAPQKASLKNLSACYPDFASQAGLHLSMQTPVHLSEGRILPPVGRPSSVKMEIPVYMAQRPTRCPYCKENTKAVARIVRPRIGAPGRKYWFCGLHPGENLGPYAEPPAKRVSRRTSPTRPIKPRAEPKRATTKRPRRRNTGRRRSR
jgi:hypothetical protein